MKKTLIFGISLGALIIIIAGFFIFWPTKPNPPETIVQIKNFDDCVALGRPIQESYPRRCATDSGQTFTEDIGNELELADLIRLKNPRPNQVIKSPLLISGEARGYWFFEASFPVILKDGNNNTLATGIAQAQNDWMTENFVPFLVSLNFTPPVGQTGFLLLQKDNPSGLPENDKTLIVPVKF